MKELKKLMLNKNMSQSVLAKQLGLSQQLVSKWINGKCQPQLPYVTKIATALGVSVEEVLNCFK